MTLDTEGTNGTNDPLVYDLGLCIHDKKGKVYETRSFVIYDIYAREKALMKSAYYAEKLPQYEIDLKNGSRKMVTIFTARKEVANLCKKYNVKAIIAHNARYDVTALNTTLRYVTKSKMRFFLPYGVPIWDSLKMARDTICKQKTYIRFCHTHGFLTTKYKQVKATAEVLYKYITADIDYKEKHTGIDDVMIEKEITCRCLRQHKKMTKNLYQPVLS